MLFTFKTNYSKIKRTSNYIVSTFKEFNCLNELINVRIWDVSLNVIILKVNVSIFDVKYLDILYLDIYIKLLCIIIMYFILLMMEYLLLKSKKHSNNLFIIIYLFSFLAKFFFFSELRKTLKINTNLLHLNIGSRIKNEVVSI